MTSLFQTNQGTSARTWFLCGLAVCAWPCLANAAIVVTERDTLQSVNFADISAFSDALASTATTLQLSGALPDTRTFGFTVATGVTNFQAVSNSPDFTVSAPTLTVGSPNSSEAVTVSATSPSLASGSVTLSEDLGVNVALSGAITSLSTGISGLGYNYLDEVYNPTANQSAGAPFNFTLKIKGDYSAVGDSTGDHQLISFNGAWTIDQNFVFDGTNTVFSAHISPYSTSQQIGLEYRLFGATAVPEPEPYALLGLGLAVLRLRSRSNDPK